MVPGFHRARRKMLNLESRRGLAWQITSDDLTYLLVIHRAEDQYTTERSVTVPYISKDAVKLTQLLSTKSSNLVKKKDVDCH